MTATSAATSSSSSDEQAVEVSTGPSVLLGPPDRHRSHSVVAMGLVVAVSVLLVTAFALGGDTGGVTPDIDGLVGDHVRSVGGTPVVVPVMLDR